MSEYTPELGQMLFGQPHKQYQVSDLVEAVLTLLRYRLETARWNVDQKEPPDPFGNSGEDFKTDVFHVQAYSWGDDEQPYNFKWRNIEISWYKYMGRGMSANMEITSYMADEMLKDCLASIGKYEAENERNDK